MNLNWLKKLLVKIWLPKTVKRIVLLLGYEHSLGKYVYRDEDLLFKYRKEITNYNAEVIEPEQISISMSKDFRMYTNMVYQCIDHKCKKLDYSDSWIKHILDIDKDLPK